MSLAAQRGWPFMRGRLARVPYLRLITHEADDFIEDGRATIEMRKLF
jgi:hypothetical protein